MLQENIHHKHNKNGGAKSESDLEAVDLSAKVPKIDAVFANIDKTLVKTEEVLRANRLGSPYSSYGFCCMRRG